jgi:hypothetical protein
MQLAGQSLILAGQSCGGQWQGKHGGQDRARIVQW